MAINYKVNEPISAAQFVGVLERSTLAKRRPVQDTQCMRGMVANADILITAWDEGLLVGVARSVTDFHYVCYLSDLAVDADYQRQGIGRQLIYLTREQVERQCTIILLAAPAVKDYYDQIGFKKNHRCWILPPGSVMQNEGLIQ